MHIPDGYLSPVSAGVLYTAMIPFWYRASRKVRNLFASKTVPLMAMMSAFCFVIQMLNIPLPGGTSGHAVGASLAAIVLTPWPAVISVSIALIIQALFFGDGGITAIGANCFNMAVAQVFVTYGLYRLLPGKKSVVAGIAGYIGLNVAALLAGLELGLQPLIAHDARGMPLYSPYPITIAVPAMMVGHFIVGFAEAIMAAAGVAYMSKAMPEMMKTPELDRIQVDPLRRARALWAALAVLVVLTPLGLLAPGTAWGEWSSEQLRGLGLDFVPAGLQRWERAWAAAFQDYRIPGLGERTGYVFSAVVGLFLIAAVFFAITMLGNTRASKRAEER